MGSIIPLSKEELKVETVVRYWLKVPLDSDV